MKKKASLSKTLKNAQIDTIKSVRLVLAVYILLMMLLQLFAIEDYIPIISEIGFGDAGAVLAVIVLVVFELLALPFWIGLKTKDVVRKFSLVSGIIALMVLTFLEVVAFQAGQTVIFGALFELPGGSWSIFFLAALWVLEIWGLTNYTNLPSPLTKKIRRSSSKK